MVSLGKKSATGNRPVALEKHLRASYLRKVTFLLNLRLRLSIL